MPRRVLVERSGEFFDLVEVPAPNEHHLQEVIKTNPQLIPSDDLGLDGDLLVVGRETTLASGAIDLLCLARSGDLVLVEFKTGPQNPDFRHALAQLIDYGSDLAADPRGLRSRGRPEVSRRGPCSAGVRGWLRPARSGFADELGHVRRRTLGARRPVVRRPRDRRFHLRCRSAEFHAGDDRHPGIPQHHNALRALLASRTRAAGGARPDRTRGAGGGRAAQADSVERSDRDQSGQ